MAWTQADLDAYDEAIKSGAQTVRFADREITYPSTDDMLKTRSFIASQVAAATGSSSSNGGGGRFVRQRRIYTDKGWSS